MAHVEKVCPVVLRHSDGCVDILAFRHPLAGNQFVKGTVEAGEILPDAALRELREESGLCPQVTPRQLCKASIGMPPIVWHFFAIEMEGLPRAWEHWTEDDGGHVFSFFWHPAASNLDHRWHPIFHDALRVIRQHL